ncbi:phage head closure protein [Paludisphaera rhizosphaerae]
MDPGQMKSRLVYEEPVEVDNDEHGRPIIEWRPRFEIWADVRPISAREASYAEQTKSLRTHVVICRWRADLNELGRLRFKGRERVMSIESITNDSEDNLQANIDAIEESKPA